MADEFYHAQSTSINKMSTRRLDHQTSIDLFSTMSKYHASIYVASAQAHTQALSLATALVRKMAPIYYHSLVFGLAFEQVEYASDV